MRCNCSKARCHHRSESLRTYQGASVHNLWLNTSLGAMRGTRINCHPSEVCTVHPPRLKPPKGVRYLKRGGVHRSIRSCPRINSSSCSITRCRSSSSSSASYSSPGAGHAGPQLSDASVTPNDEKQGAAGGSPAAGSTPPAAAPCQHRQQQHHGQQQLMAQPLPEAPAAAAAAPPPAAATAAAAAVSRRSLASATAAALLWSSSELPAWALRTVRCSY